MMMSDTDTNDNCNFSTCTHKANLFSFVCAGGKHMTYSILMAFSQNNGHIFLTS